MADRDRELLARIEWLERELKAIKAEVGRRDRWPSAEQPAAIQPPPVVVPPPVIATPPQATTPPPSAIQAPEPQPSTPQPPTPEPPFAKPQGPPKPARDIEFQLGGRVLAIAGATVVVLGMLYLVALAITNRWITLEAQWAGEMIFSGLLVAIGLWKLNEREDFGQILTGTGLCGAYLSFAGAQVYKGIISQQTMVAGFVGLSLAAIALGVWRESKPFFVFGVLGGFLAASLPLNESRAVTGQAIHAAVLLPAVVIVSRRKWLDMAYVVWPVSLALGFWGLWILSSRDMSLRSEGLLVPVWQAWVHYAAATAFSLAATLAYLRAHKPNKAEGGPAVAWFAPALTVGLPLSAVPIVWSQFGWAATLAVCLLFFGLARFSASQQARSGLVAGAIVAAAVVPWLTLTAHQASAVFAAECLVAALWAARRQSLPVARLSVALGFLSATAGLAEFANWLSPGAIPSRLALDVATALSLVVAAVVLLRAPWPQRDSAEQSLAFAGVAALTRATTPLLIVAGLPNVLAVGWALTLSLLVLPVVISRTRSVSPAPAFWLSAVLATVLAIAAPANPAVGPAANVPLCAALLVALVAVVPAYVRASPSQAPGTAVLASLLATYPFGRLVFIGAGNLGADPLTSLVLGMGLFSALCALIARLTGWRELGTAGAVYAALAAVPYALLLEPEATRWSGWERGSDIVSSLAMMGAVAAVTWGLIKAEPGRQSWSRAVGAVLFGVPFARLVYTVLAAPSVGLQAFQAVLLFCAAYAACLALVGAVRRSVELSWAAAVYLGAALLLYPMMKVPDYAAVGETVRSVSWQADLVALAALLVASMVTSRSLLANGLHRAGTLGTFAVLDWPIVAGGLMILAQQPPLDLRFDASMTGAWVVYGATLLVLGFAKGEAVLRVTGLTVFAATLVKVFIYDLSFLEAPIKIVLLLGFGLVMLALSYAYIRASKRRELVEGQGT